MNKNKRTILSKKNKIYEISKEDLQKIIDKSSSYREVLRNLGYKSTVSFYSILKIRIQEENLNTDKMEGNERSIIIKNVI